MPQDADAEPEDKSKSSRPKAQSEESLQQWFTTPPLIRRLFDRFPQVTYASNQLPQRAARQRDRHALYVFTSWDGAIDGAASFNPGCLKWQVRSPLDLDNLSDVVVHRPSHS